MIPQTDRANPSFKNEIKKILYKEKPLVQLIERTETSFRYKAPLTVIVDGQNYVEFLVPLSEMGEKEFEDQLPAQLLIRWMI